MGEYIYFGKIVYVFRTENNKALIQYQSGEQTKWVDEKLLQPLKNKNNNQWVDRFPL